MGQAVAQQVGSPLVLIGDEIGPKPHLKSLVDLIRAENEQLPEEMRISYLVCRDLKDLALALRRNRRQIRLVLIGPDLDGKPDMVGRLLGRSVQTIIVLDPKHPLDEDPAKAKRVRANLEEIGNTLIPLSDATEKFYQPLVEKYVLSGMSPEQDFARMSPDERTALLDKRLEAVTRFPTLPDTQQKVSKLDDMDPPKKWAEAIDPDVPIRSVILASLNSAHYSFRYPIKSIDQAVSLASAGTIRELVTACTVRRLFKNVKEARVEDFWRHSVMVGLFAKLFSMPASSEEQSPHQKKEFARLDLESYQKDRLAELAFWKSFDLDEDLDPFAGGLLHDIGKVTTALCFEEAHLMLDPMIEDAVSEADGQGTIWAAPPLEIERTLMKDMDHQIVGGRIARKWGLDTRLQQVISQHHTCTRNATPLVKLVALADLATNTICSYPIREEHAPLTRVFDRIRERAEENPGDPLEQADALFQESKDELDGIVERMEVPEHLWKLIDRQAFFTLTYLLGPRMKKATAAFLQMTTVVG